MLLTELMCYRELLVDFFKTSGRRKPAQSTVFRYHYIVAWACLGANPTILLKIVAPKFLSLILG